MEKEASPFPGVRYGRRSQSVRRLAYGRGGGRVWRPFVGTATTLCYDEPMITRLEVWRRTDGRLRARSVRSYAQARKLFEALYREARALKVLPARNRLEGLEADLRLAAALNRLPR